MEPMQAALYQDLGARRGDYPAPSLPCYDVYLDDADKTR